MCRHDRLEADDRGCVRALHFDRGLVRRERQLGAVHVGAIHVAETDQERHPLLIVLRVIDALREHVRELGVPARRERETIERRERVAIRRFDREDRAVPLRRFVRETERVFFDARDLREEHPLLGRVFGMGEAVIEERAQVVPTAECAVHAIEHVDRRGVARIRLEDRTELRDRFVRTPELLTHQRSHTTTQLEPLVGVGGLEALRVELRERLVCGCGVGGLLETGDDRRVTGRGLVRTRGPLQRCGGVVESMRRQVA